MELGHIRAVLSLGLVRVHRAVTVVVTVWVKLPRHRHATNNTAQVPLNTQLYISRFTLFLPVNYVVHHRSTTGVKNIMYSARLN